MAHVYWLPASNGSVFAQGVSGSYWPGELRELRVWIVQAVDNLEQGSALPGAYVVVESRLERRPASPSAEPIPVDKDIHISAGQRACLVMLLSAVP